MPFNINGWELIMVVVLFLILFGPDRLPEVAVQIGKLVREVRKASQAATSEISRELENAAAAAGTSTDEIRHAGETARRAVQDTSRVVSAVVGGSGVREIGAAVSSAADAARGTGQVTGTGGVLGAGAVGEAGVIPDAEVVGAKDLSPLPTGNQAAGAEGATEAELEALPEPIDVDMLARRITPFDLESGSG